MNREIKFRAFNEKEGMCFPDKIRSDLHIEFTMTGELLFGRQADETRRWKLMQYTGLKDKNGVEIYEGDILTDGRELGCVLWFKHNCEFVLHYQDYIEEEDLDPDCDVVNHCGWVGLEIIGNIYENPELLEATQ